jgi:hypothetical protein
MSVLIMINKSEKSKWMDERMAKGYSFTYTKGIVPGGCYSDGTPEKHGRNVSVTCVEDGCVFNFDWQKQEGKE